MYKLKLKFVILKYFNSYLDSYSLTLMWIKASVNIKFTLWHVYMYQEWPCEMKGFNQITEKPQLFLNGEAQWVGEKKKRKSFDSAFLQKI